MSSNSKLNDVDRSIIKYAAYHRPELDKAVLSTASATKPEPVRKLLLTSYPRPQLRIALAGILSVFPMEIILMICERFDLASLLILRRMNTFWRTVITGLNMYKATMTWAMEPYFRILKTGLYLRLKDLYRALCGYKCAECGHFGSFLFLPTLERSCLICLQRASRFEMLCLNKISKLTHLSVYKLKKLFPVVRSPPGKYGMWPKYTSNMKLCLLSCAQVREVTGVQGVRAPTINFALDETLMKRFRSSVMVPYICNHGHSSERGLACGGCIWRYDEEFQKHGLVRTLEQWNMMLDLDIKKSRMFTATGFIRHFKECEYAQKLLEDLARNNKKRPPLPASVSSSYLFLDGQILL